MSQPAPLIVLLLALVLAPALPAQEAEPPVDEDGSSEQVEQSDEAFRRRMELEDARRRDPSYTIPADTQKPKQEKIDALPQESRENIRDQLVDIIVENGEWEPSDALEEFPYEPTEAALSDPELLQQELEAWDEQVQKYHEREAAAFGAYRGPVPGPGNPDGPEGTGGEGGSAGEAGSPGDPAAAGGTSVPTAAYRSDRPLPDDAASTAGVSESALDFLRQRGGAGPAAGSGPEGMRAAGAAAAGRAPVTPAEAVPADPEDAAGDSAAAPEEPAPVTPGILAIEDLDKLEGVEPTEPEEREDPR